MALQLSDTVRNAIADALETAIGTSPKLQIRSGSVPANCAAADAGTLLAEIAVPSDWLAAASGGAKTLLGTWSTNAVATGTAAHFRLKNNAGTATHMQGTITATGGGGDMIMDNTALVGGQLVTANTYTITTANS